jgi:hypothetical protein
MSIQVNNLDSQLNVIINGVLDVYNFSNIKSVGRSVDASGNHYVSINFIANDKNNSLRIPLSQLIDPVSWTNDTAGAQLAVETIRSWMQISVVATIKSPLGQQSNGNSVSTVLSNEQANVEISSFIKRYTAADNDAASAASATVLSISFASVGTADARISYNGGTNFEILKPGETLNLDAGGVMNYYNGSRLTWDTTTNAGSSLLIAINYI